MALAAGAAAGRASGGWTGDQKGAGRAWAGVEAGRERAGGAGGEGMAPARRALDAGYAGVYSGGRGIEIPIAASELCFVSDVPGVRLAGDDIAAELTCDQVEAAIADGTIHGGMVIKVRVAIDALDHGVRSVWIADVAGLAAGGGTVLTSAGVASTSG